MQRNAVLIIVGVLLALGMLLFRDGMTGMLIFDWKSSCRVNLDCSPGNTCCLFYQESYGVCDAAESCTFIRDVSRVEKESLGLAGTVGTAPVLEAPAQIQQAQNRDILVLLLGIALVIIVLYYYIRFEQRQKRRRKYRKKK